MFKTLFDFILNRKGHPATDAAAKPEVVAVADAPVVIPKIEPMKCGCGRSQTGYCVGLHKLTGEEWSVHADNPNKAPVKKPRAAKKPDTKKPAAMKAPAKPRAKKAKE